MKTLKEIRKPFEYDVDYLCVGDDDVLLPETLIHQIQIATVKAVIEEIEDYVNNENNCEIDSFDRIILRQQKLNEFLLRLKLKK